MKKVKLLICFLVISFIASAHIYVHPDSCNANITVSSSPSDSSCAGVVTSNSGPVQTVISTSSSIVLTAHGGVTYFWSTGSTHDTTVITQPGTYTVNGTDANGCTRSASIIVYPGLGYNVSLYSSIPNNNLCGLALTPGSPAVVQFVVNLSGASTNQYRAVWPATGGAVLTPNHYYIN